MICIHCNCTYFVLFQTESNNKHNLFAGKKILKLNGNQWVALGCPQKHEAEDVYQAPEGSLHGVLCCSIDGKKCSSEHQIEGTNHRCHNATFEKAKEICTRKGGNYRLCLPEELNSCCDGGCEQQFDDKSVWIETSSKGITLKRQMVAFNIKNDY